jgi:hypothetical protein
LRDNGEVTRKVRDVVELDGCAQCKLRTGEFKIGVEIKQEGRQNKAPNCVKFHADTSSRTTFNLL